MSEQATSSKMSVKQIATQLAQENELLKQELAEKNARIEELEQQLQKKKRVVEKVVGKYEELVASKGEEWVNRRLTKKELTEIIANPTKELELGGSSRGNGAGPSQPREEKNFEGQCYARVWNKNIGGRCGYKAVGGTDYCKTHGKQASENHLTNGDIRITGKGSIPLSKGFEKKLYGEEEFYCPEDLNPAIVGIQ